MSGPIIMILTLVIGLAGLMFWNKGRVKGKMLCFFLRKDKSVFPGLCSLRDDFVIWGERAYDIYPDLVRLIKFPQGWPSFLQELVPTALYLEEDAVPLDWIDLDNREVRAMELRAALDENWIKKLVQETVEQGKGGINWRKILPIGLLAVGLLGLVFILFSKGCFSGTPPA